MITYETQKPRIIIEQQADGTLIMLSWLNGNETRVTLARGFEFLEMKEALTIQQRQILRQKEASAQYLSRQEAERHKRVIAISAATKGQGVEFASRVVGGNASPAPLAPKRGDVSPKATALEDLF